MTAIVRPSEDKDLPAITAIYEHAVLNGTASFEIDPPDQAEVARRREALLSAGFPYLVAEVDGRVVGYAYAGPYRPRPAYQFTVEDSIYVAPDVQGRGVGRALLSSLIAHCERQGFRQMVGVIGDSSSTGSIALHRSLGFLNAGVVRDVGYKHGRWLDQVIMQRRLGAGAEGVPVMESAEA
ncbi:GNAT family N-acetyltransferase [Alsobacter soli]|uniref:GNAT family N-acetyltransferase n=1 Tax=Alsobacter soli TaxID=2109933 RepID=A0A2T1HZ90_9HYPH|nr:GNAT family N-acetyltransferase [Alsobacter soli]PSC07013.1 GNAT family N-acetyltransferase [Alsobacter soli]